MTHPRPTRPPTTGRRSARGAVFSIVVPTVLLGSALLALAPTAGAHTCFAETYAPEDPSDCDGHDCRSHGIHLGHVVLHRGDNGGFHGCGILLHVGVDGTGPYVCVEGLRGTICLESARPAGWLP